MPAFNEPILRMARHVADIKRGGKSIEEKADAIGSFVTSFLLDTLRRSDTWPASPKPEPTLTVVEEAAASVCCEPAALAAAQTIIRIKPPVIVKQLATELGINFDRGTVTVPASIAKTGRKRKIVMSENLLEWLAPYRVKSGPIFDIDPRKRIAKIVKASGVKWKRNALRHS